MKKNYVLFLVIITFSFALNGQTRLTQSMDPFTIDTDGIACVKSTEKDYNDNYFYRAYKLSDFGITGDFQISALEFGQGKARDGKTLTLNIYTVDTDDLTIANFTFRGSTTHLCSSLNNSTLISESLSVTIPAGSTIAFEIFAAANGDGLGSTDTTEDFLPGFNITGEDDDSYRKSLDCFSPNDINTLTTLGASNNQYVMNIVGSEVLSVKDFESFELGVAPNPSSDFVNIKLDQSNKVKRADLYDVMGKLVMQTYQTSKIDVSNLKTGMYILKLSTDKGNAVRRIVKQ